jgi:molecular chaperone GrpE
MENPHVRDDEAVALETEDTASLVAENAILRDRYLRALADAENTRRRSERLEEEARAYAVTKFARELLPVADNLERAIVAAQDSSTNDAALLEGVSATARMLAAAFEQFGVRKIESLGSLFDPKLQEAVMELYDEAQAPGTVLQVLEDGYTIHDRLLRPARVVVGKRRPAQFSSHA